MLSTSPSVGEQQRWELKGQVSHLPGEQSSAETSGVLEITADEPMAGQLQPTGSTIAPSSPPATFRLSRFRSTTSSGVLRSYVKRIPSSDKPWLFTVVWPMPNVYNCILRKCSNVMSTVSRRWYLSLCGVWRLWNRSIELLGYRDGFCMKHPSRYLSAVTINY